MSILLSGGLGYIGSHTCALLENYSKIIIVDNLANSKIDVLAKIKLLNTKSEIIFYKTDILNIDELDKVFAKEQIETIIHFAGLKSVFDSIKNPLTYYDTNIVGTLNILKMMDKYTMCNKLIFSSSATVYGAQKSPVTECAETGNNITNPYGKTKYFIEEILKDYSKANVLKNIIILRYFNPVGAHESGLIGEDPNDTPNNLSPYLLQVAFKKKDKLSVFGNDYNTPDGTCIRDFIHVVDLARAHVLCVCNDPKGLVIYNVGTGKGTSVLEFIKCFEKYNNIKLNYEFVARRDGDLEMVYADVTKINRELNFYAEKTLKDICCNSYKFYNNMMLKYNEQ